MRWFLLTLCLPPCYLVQAQEASTETLRPQDYLKLAGTALRNLDYKGVFTYEQGGQRTSQQWVHAVRNGVEHERLLGLDGAHREILRERPLGCMQTSEKAIYAHLLTALDQDFGALGAMYDFSMGSVGSIAERAVIVIVVAPRDKFRFGYRLFLDHETHLLLGADLLDKQGESLERFRFIQVQIGDVKDADLQPMTTAPLRLDASQCVDNEKSLDVDIVTHWRFDLPEGYQLCSQENSTEGNTIEDALTFSDGLSHFTVFVRPQTQSKSGGRMQQGNTLLRSESIEITGKLYEVTVVGEIPEATAQRVIASIKPVASNTENH